MSKNRLTMILTYPVMLGRLGSAHIGERPLRTVLTVCGVALGVAAFIAVRTANVDVLRAFTHSVALVSGTATLEVIGTEGRMDETFVSQVRQTPDVVSADPVLTVEVRLAGGPRDGEAWAIVGLDLIDIVFRQDVKLSSQASSAPLERLTAADSLFLGHELGTEWGVKEGDRIQVRAGSHIVSLYVAGVMQAAAGTRSRWNRIAVMDIAAAQKTFALIGKLDRLELTTDSSRPVDLIEQQLRAVLPPSLTVQRPEARGRQVENMVRAFQTNLTVLSMVGLLVGVFLIYNTVSFSVVQRRREIGILRALGMSEHTVAALFIFEAAAMGLVGGLAGASVGLAGATALTDLLGRTVTELYAVVPDSISDRIATHWSSAALLGALVGIVVSALGAGAPSMEAGRTEVVQALAPGSYEVARQSIAWKSTWVGLLLLLAAGALSWGPSVAGIPVFGYGSAFCLLAGLAALAPLVIHGLGWINRWRSRRRWSKPGALEQLAVEQLGSGASRNAVTVSALLVGVAIMVGVVMMVRSFRHTVEIWIAETVMADLIVTPQAWLQGSRAAAGARTLPASWREEILRIPGVSAVDSYRERKLYMGDKVVSLVARDLRLHAERSSYLVQSGHSTDLLLRAADNGGVLISEVLAGRLEVRVGDQLKLPTPLGPQSVPVVAIFYDYATDGGKLVMDRATYHRWWTDDDTVTVFPVYLTAAADPARVRGTIAHRLAEMGSGVGPAIVSNGELRREILDIFDRTFFLTYVLEIIAVLIAVLGIVNTLVTSVLERRREFATLQAIGASERQIRGLVLWEAIYLGAVGAVLGLAGGIALSVMLVKVINKQSFGWTIKMAWTPGVWLEAVTVSIAVAVLAGYWPARWASRQPAAEGLRYE